MRVRTSEVFETSSFFLLKISSAAAFEPDPAIRV